MNSAKFIRIAMATVFLASCAHNPGIGTRPSRIPASSEDPSTQLAEDLKAAKSVKTSAVPILDRNRLARLSMEHKGFDEAYGLNNKVKMTKLEKGQSPSFINNANAFNEQKSDKDTKKQINKNHLSPYMISLAKNLPEASVKKGRNNNYTSVFKTEEQARKDAAVKKEKRPPRRPAQSTGCLSSYEDYYEPNDNRLSNYSLVSYKNRWLSTVSGRGVQYDDDWFKINVPNSERNLVIDLRYLSSCSDIDLALYDENGTQVASSTSSNDDEYISVTLNRGGNYYVKVFYDNEGGYYDLLWNTYYTGAPDDLYEDNDNQYSAYDIRGLENRWLSGTYLGGGVANDSDWYKIEAYQGFLRITADLRFYHYYGDIDMELVNSNGSVIASSRSSSDDEYIDFTVANPGIYYIKIYPFSSSSAGNTYDFKWYLTQTGPIWTEDFYEPNDYQSSAFSISSNQLISANQFDDDWYKITVGDTGRRIQVTLESAYSEGDIDVRLYNAAGTNIATSNGYSNREYIDTNVLSSAGTYYIKVYGNNKGNPYTLRAVSVTTPPTDDNYEPNNTLAAAFDLSAYNNVWLSNISGQGMEKNDDVFKFYVGPNDKNITVDLRYTESHGNLGFELWDQNDNRIAVVNTGRDGEQLDITVPLAGQYFKVRVYGPHTGQYYDLKWTAKPPAVNSGERVMNWAEFVYPSLFPTPHIPGVYEIYTYRFYPATATYVAYTPADRIILHNWTQWNFFDVGSIYDFLPAAEAAGF